MICTFAWVLTEVALGQKKTLARRGRSVFTLKIQGLLLGKTVQGGKVFVEYYSVFEKMREGFRNNNLNLIFN